MSSFGDLYNICLRKICEGCLTEEYVIALEKITTDENKPLVDMMKKAISRKDQEDKDAVG